MNPLVSARQIRAMDAQTIALGMPSLVLMERAALGASDLIPEVFQGVVHIGIFCGTGNNGGDGLAMARILFDRGYDVFACVLGREEDLSSDAEINLNLARQWGVDVSILEHFSQDAWDEILEHIGPVDLWVDALLGTGLTRTVTGSFEDAIRFLNTQENVFAIDIPSGLDADTGRIHGVATRATATATFGFAKLGLALGAGREHAGEIHVVDIGIPERVVQQVGWEAVLLTSASLKVPRRVSSMHKGNAGRVLVIGGSPNMVGAAVMAGRAALARGAGLVTIGTALELAPKIGLHHPELMSSPAIGEGILPSEDLLTHADTIILGPGLSVQDCTQSLMDVVCTHARRLVLDAGALQALALHPRALPECTILTPHPGEAARLLNCSIADVLANPLMSVRRIAETYGAHVILKGSTTIITHHDGIAVNVTGNPGMAVGGMGDILSGILAAALSEMDVFEAMCHSVCLHGFAGDMATQDVGQRGLTPLKLLDTMVHLWPSLEVV